MNRVRVLVVDDSVVFRTQIRAALEQSPQIEVAGSANNGKIAIQKLEQLSVDVVTLDMEMPEMDGPATIREIRSRGFPVRILIFSSRTQRGSEAALQALSLGADDFLAKVDSTQSKDSHNPADAIAKELIPKVLQFRDSGKLACQSIQAPESTKRNASPKKRSLTGFMPAAIVIGSSTGGPQALESILSTLGGPLRIPIFIAQHMPPVFTASLAKRIKERSGIECAEGQEMESIIHNKIYVAPGDFHMNIVKMGDKNRISLSKSPQRNSVRPAVDYLFESAAAVYGKDLMSFVLTGMGEDGLQGCRSIKEAGGGLAIQDKESCIVFGMPGAIFQNDLQDEILTLEQINQMIKAMAVSPKGLL